MNARHLSTKFDLTPADELSRSRIVAAVYSDKTLAAALALPPSPAAPDWLELRVDSFHDRPGALDPLREHAPRPFIVTVRHPAEGGAAGVPPDPETRGRLYERFLSRPGATAVDVEVRSLRALARTIGAARKAGCLVIGSFHDFEAVPSVGRLRACARRAWAGGADVFKLAATVRRPGDLARLLDLLEWGREQGRPLAVMGMGPLGKVSRLALAAAGSVLNYGYLGDDGPQVPGQWPVARLHERIAECREEPRETEKAS